ncbi:MAG: thioredoxin family protein [Chloroflexales bacterium]
MIERTLILVALAAALAVGYWLLQGWQARRLRNLESERPFAGLVPVGKPAVVAFTLPTCVDCKARQVPALRRLSESLGDRVNIQTLTVSDHPDLADRLGLLTVPATAVVDAGGVLRHLNQGFADVERLTGQLSAVGS